MASEPKWYAVHVPTNSVASIAQKGKFEAERACIEIARMYQVSLSSFESKMLTDEQVKGMKIYRSRIDE